jgi:hypothetical protein
VSRDKVFAGQGKKSVADGDKAELEPKIGPLTMEKDRLKTDSEVAPQQPEDILISKWHGARAALLCDLATSLRLSACRAVNCGVRI